MRAAAGGSIDDDTCGGNQFKPEKDETLSFSLANTRKHGMRKG
jgi:hypothetical protein